MRKVPLSTLEEKRYNQEGWRWGFDGLKPGTLHGSLESCSPDCPYIPSRTFSLWYRQVYRVQEPLSKPLLVSSFPHYLTKTWQEVTNVSSREWEENAQKTLLKGLLVPSWFPEKKDMLMMGAGQKPDGDYPGLTGHEEHPTLPDNIQTKIFHIFKLFKNIKKHSCPLRLSLEPDWPTNHSGSAWPASSAILPRSNCLPMS